MRIQSSCKCSDRRSALPAFQWCPAPSCGGFRLLGAACLWQVCSWVGSTPTCIWITCWVPGLPCSGLTRCPLWQGACQRAELGRKTVPTGGGKRQPQMPGPVDQAASSYCRLWKNAAHVILLPAMEDENRKR